MPRTKPSQRASWSSTGEYQAELNRFLADAMNGYSNVLWNVPLLAVKAPLPDLVFLERFVQSHERGPGAETLTTSVVSIHGARDRIDYLPYFLIFHSNPIPDHRCIFPSHAQLASHEINHRL
uniref:Uncharacterized protein n=1 Tax=Compsopogon caeruleus TaxID=31354 RepID=A0A7S1XGB0_9RHOD|mmetsp:Transcript_5740/g.11398  ORF Transcript_5740/g.11398 Transcript_5740/m.11398 type:complete len:122 (+) Transcript_5740:324-689(+)